jgi:hypothetical protein
MANTSNRTLQANSIAGLNVPRNYISNPSAHINTAGWATYADAAQATPVDGTGGSPNITWTRTTSSPLSLDASFLLTKDAANRQGQGVSFDFSIDAADQGKVLTVSFDYQIASGTYADGDLTVYLYDVTNATVIQPSGYIVQNGTVVMTEVCQFQSATNSTSYRLIIHVASTSASAYTVKVDNVSVSRQVIAQGTPVTDWRSFSLTIGATTSAPTLGTIAVNEARWRRDGDVMEIYYSVAQTTTGSSGTGTYLFPLPSGYSIDTAKVTPDTGGKRANLGHGYVYAGTGGVTYQGYLAMNAYNTTNLVAEVVWTTVSGAGGYGGNPLSSTNFAIGTNSPMSITFMARVPIAGWSSNVQMSSDTDTRVVAATYFRNTNQSVSSGTIIDFSQRAFDTHAAVTTGASWRFTAPVPGVYDVSLTIHGGDSTTTSYQLFKNGVFVSFILTTNSAIIFSGARDIDLNANDYIDIRANATTTVTGTNSSTVISIARRSGPSQIAASETIAFRARSSTTAATTSTPFIFTVVEGNTHGAYNSSTGRFTVPAAGWYQINASVYTANVFTLRLYIDGVLKTQFVASGTGSQASGGSDLRYLTAGQVLELRPDSSVTASAVNQELNYFTVHRVGI